jgi:hypothetical protein
MLACTSSQHLPRILLILANYLKISEIRVIRGQVVLNCIGLEDDKT